MDMWPVRKAKDHLSELLAAADHSPQTISRHGTPSHVVLSTSTYQRLVRHPGSALIDFIDGFHLGDLDLDFTRVKAHPREDVEL